MNELYRVIVFDSEKNSINDLKLIKKNYQYQFNDYMKCSKKKVMMMQYYRDYHE